MIVPTNSYGSQRREWTTPALACLLQPEGNVHCRFVEHEVYRSENRGRKLSLIINHFFTVKYLNIGRKSINPQVQ